MATINSNGTGGGDWNAGPTWVGGSVPDTTDRANIVSGDTVTLSANPTNSIGSCGLEGTLECTNTPLITILGDGNGSVMFHQGTLTGDCDLKITGGSAKEIADIGTGNFNDIELDNSGNTLTIGNGTLTVDGDLTITAGTLNTSASSNFALTVTGDVDIATAGTLTTNASAIIIGALSCVGSALYNATTNANGTIITSRHSALGRGLSCGSVDRVTHNNG